MTMLEDRPVNAARRAMIDSQLRVSGVNDPVILTAIDRVAREDFVPAALRASAYIDRALPLGDGAMLPAPLVQGMMLTEAAPVPGEAVLVVSDTGYLAAIVAEMGCRVTTVAPAEAASGDGAGEPVSLILIDGAIEQLPAALAGRLVEGGRIVTGLAERGVTRLAGGRRIAGEVTLQPLADVGMPVLPAFAAPQRWSF